MVAGFSWTFSFDAFLKNLHVFFMSSLTYICQKVPGFSSNKLFYCEFLRISILHNFKDFLVTLSFENSHIDQNISRIWCLSKALLHIFNLPE